MQSQSFPRNMCGIKNIVQGIYPITAIPCNMSRHCILLLITISNHIMYSGTRPVIRRIFSKTHLRRRHEEDIMTARRMALLCPFHGSSVLWVKSNFEVSWMWPAACASSFIASLGFILHELHEHKPQYITSSIQIIHTNSTPLIFKFAICFTSKSSVRCCWNTFQS